MATEGLQILLDGFMRILQILAMQFDRSANMNSSQVEKITHKLVGVLGRNTKARQSTHWKISQIRGNDHVGSRANGCGKHMAVVGVRQAQAGDQVGVALDQAIENRGIHQISRTFQLFSRKVGTVS